MLSTTSRWLTRLSAGFYAVVGIWLFLAPARLAPVFAWKVSEFVTMTIGAWCLGNAWLAWISARRWAWRRVRASLVYLWLFGVLQSGVVLAFRDRLALAHPVAWLYLAALILNVLLAVVGVFEAMRRPPAAAAPEGDVRRAHRALVVVFVLFVGFLALYGLAAPPGAPGTNGGIFPEVMSPFTLRSFAAFYLALALGTAPLIVERSLAALLHHAWASYGLVVAITAAAIAYLELFDFAARPGGLIYLGAYLAVGVPLVFAFRAYGTGSTGRQAGRPQVSGGGGGVASD